MKEKSSYHLFTLIALLALTIATAIVASAAHSAVVVLVLAMAKILLVTFRFMELRHAHIFWKAGVLFLAGGILGVIAILAV